jgi:hypothetical protein
VVVLYLQGMLGALQFCCRDDVSFLVALWTAPQDVLDYTWPIGWAWAFPYSAQARSVMERGVPCRSAWLEVRARHNPVNITWGVPCRWPVGFIMLGRSKARIFFIFVFFLQKLFLIKKLI